MATMTIRGQEVEAEETFFFCPNVSEEESEFVHGGMLDRNLLAARDAYRKAVGLLTTKEIKGIRHSLGLTQRDLSLLLGWGAVTVTRYETTTIQEETYDEMMRRVSVDPRFALAMLERHAASFPKGRYERIRSSLRERARRTAPDLYAQDMLEKVYARFAEPNGLNGDKELDRAKLEDVVAYFALHVPKLPEPSLWRMLWYADRLHYRSAGTSMTGLVYVRGRYGPQPFGMDPLAALPSVTVEETLDAEGLGTWVATTRTKADLRFAKYEAAILRAVVKELGCLTPKALVERFLEDDAIRSTPKDEVIPYRT